MMEPVIDGRRLLTLALATLPLAGLAAAGAQPSPDPRALARQKIESRLLQELDRKRGVKVGSLETGIAVDSAGRVKLDVRADVSDALLARIAKLGGQVLSSSPPHRSVLARFPLLKLEQLASLKDVYFVEPAAEAVTH